MTADPLAQAWSEFFAAWCRLRALAEEDGGATLTMEVKVKEAPQKKEKRRGK